MQYLLFGANGYVGNYLYKHMKKDGLCVIGTKHCNKGERELIAFDVLKDSVSDIIKLVKGKDKIAIYCIAQANLERCQIEYDLSRQINVVMTQKVIERLLHENFRVIYFSTDNVFDGVKGNYTELDVTHAVSQYGKMKEETEHYLLDNCPGVCIFRMPRVICTKKEKQNLLTDFENKLMDKEVKCIKNNKMSIIAREDIYQACLIAAGKKMRGLYNLANGEIYSRKELAIKYFNAMGAKNMDIVELDLEKFGFKDIRPLDVGLDNSKFKQETGYTFMTYDMVIEQYIKSNRSN